MKKLLLKTKNKDNSSRPHINLRCNVMLKAILFIIMTLNFSFHSNAVHWPVTITCPANGELLNPTSWSGKNMIILPISLNPVYCIASISSTAISTDYDLEALVVNTTTSKSSLIFSTSQPKFWVWRRGNPNYGNFSQTPICDGCMSYSGQIVPDNTNNNTYDVWVEFAMNGARANCEHISFDFITTCATNEYGDWGQQSGSATCTIDFSRYTTDRNVYNTPDLFVKDNFMDYGAEPLLLGNVDASVSILNTLYNTASRTFNGLNPDLSLSNYAQRSTQGNYNYMNVLVENRACVATTSTATLELFWTINKTYEPWSHDWFNYQNNSFASSNWVDYSSSSSITRYPAGNQITISDKSDYYSSNQPVTIPSGIQPTMTDANDNHYGGYLASVQWNPPNPAWYLQAFSSFHWYTATEPVICYMAVITEPDKTNDGFHVPQPRTTANVKAATYAFDNNNVATVNSYLATPKGSYKHEVTGTNSYRSNTGAIVVNNPYNKPVVNLSIEGDQIDQNFYNNGAVYLIFNELLWERWTDATGEGQGTGFEVITEQVIKLTNPNAATLTNIAIGQDEQGMLGVMFEYDGDNVPETDYYYGFTLGAYDADTSSNDSIIISGDPTYFNTIVLNSPQVEEEEEYLTHVKNNAELNIDFISLYPNPASDRLNLHYYLKSDSRLFSIEIYDMQGMKVESILQNNLKKGKKQNIIDITGLSSGNYLIKLSSDNTYKTLKFVK